MPSDQVFYVAAIVLLLIAAVPNKLNVRCDLLAYACLVASLLN